MNKSKSLYQIQHTLALINYDRRASEVETSWFLAMFYGDLLNYVHLMSASDSPLLSPLSLHYIF